MMLECRRKITSTLDFSAVLKSFSVRIAAAIFLRTAEPGRIRLRAVEVTTGHSLSPYELDEKTSRDHAGGDALFNGLEFIVGEGDLVHPYAARFEVCFRPASGGPERTIGSRVYRIVGSQF